MADGYARIAGRPGVCMAQSVGAANLASGLQDAFLGHSPVIALTGRKEPSFQHRNAYQEIAHAPLFAAVTKFSAPVDSTAELPRLLRHAWRAALADTPRPTHLDFCGLQGDVIELGETAEPTDPRPRGAAYPGAPAGRRRARSRTRRRSAGGLPRASPSSPATGPPPRRPGRKCSPWPRRWRRRSRRRSARAASSRPGTGLSVGVAGSYSAPPANRIVHGADLVLFIGCDTGDQVTLNWTVPARATRIVQIDADPLEIGRSYPNTTGLVGDPKATLARLNQLDRAAGARSAALPRRRRVSSPIGAPDGAARRTTTGRRSGSSGCAPRLPGPCRPTAILVADTGYSGIWTGTMIDFNGAGQTYLRAAGSLGWSFPASLGAQCAAPDRAGCCASPAMAGSTTTSPNWRRRAAAASPSPIVVNNNSGFGQNLTGVRRIAGNRPGRGEELVRFGPTDFTAVAQSFGVRGIRVEHPAEIAPALAEALGADEPVRDRCRDRSRTARPRAVGTRPRSLRSSAASGASRRPGGQPPTSRLRILSNTGSICAR